MTIAVLAEKPSVARDLAKVLGAGKSGPGFLHGNGYVVTWAVGHLAALAQPHEIRPEWKSWRRELLPMLPEQWPLVVYEKTKDQFETVRRILVSPKVASVVCATDAGREGELIFRYIYEASGCTKPVERLWISSLTPDAIRKGFAALRRGADYDPLADAARGRSRADWLVGLNLSRAYTITYGDELSVGRVQTPTLAMVVERELAIRNFVPEDYIEVEAVFRPSANPQSESYRGTWFRDAADIQKSSRLAPDGIEAAEIVARAKSGKAAIESVKAETQRMGPPQFYDLTELQRHANRLFGFSAQKTLDIAQSLYERHKLISYPRTDSRHLSNDVAATLPRIVPAIAEPYREHLAPGSGVKPLGKKFVDDAKVGDHHAIIPTVAAAARANLTDDERRIYDLVCRRLLTAWHEDHVWSVTTVITAISNHQAPLRPMFDRYHSSGKAIQQVGWKVLDPQSERKTVDPEQSLPAGLEPAQAQDVLEAVGLKKKTRAPKRLTDATLLTAMETAGKTLDEKELSDAMKETGLGTPATRAAIIEVLLKREYIARDGKNLEATEKGIRLVEVVHPEVKSPAMTGQWEAFLKRIERGEARLQPFLDGIEHYVSDVVGKVLHAPPSPPRAQRETGPKAPPEQPPPHAPPALVARSGEPLAELLRRAFGFSSFRANQEQVCQTVLEGRDALLVMPTGAGKSLCYQLPGLALGGTTLVISPLIALMDDQASKLRERGFRVEQIHSGRGRGDLRQASLEYLAGNLQFLFIAPERLRVNGFPQMLARKKPSLVAIDEAHCISQWGHDFRPDYRLIGDYLPMLRPAPVIALTATATALVQQDIRNQLGFEGASSFVHGFRRSNIAIELVETSPGQRAGLALQLLDNENHRPAIVYTPSRRQAGELAELIAEHFPAAAYHAGLEAERRWRVQDAFLAGKLEVIVATIAFGMGIDKPDIRSVIHTALPGSVEAYYQEIGRAGRDGKPSRAVLMHSYADRYTHDRFFERDYPPVELLDQVHRRLGEQPRPKAFLAKQSKLPAEIFDIALERLWMHGGAEIDSSDDVTRGEGAWRDSYLAQSAQKQAQIEAMIRFAQSSQCRMSSLVRHFGDMTDAQTPCRICDFCDPESCAAQQYRPASELEKSIALEVIEELEAGSRSTGKLHAELCPRDRLSRDAFEELLAAMTRAGFLRSVEATFEKDGKQIPFRKVSLARDAEELLAGGEWELVVRGEFSPAESGAAKKRSPRTKKGTPAKAGKAKRGKPAAAPLSEPPAFQMLREWRVGLAKRQGVPAFRILSDRVLLAIAREQPRTAAELLAIPGMGIKLVEKYGAQIYRILGGLRSQ